MGIGMGGRRRQVGRERGCGVVRECSVMGRLVVVKSCLGFWTTTLSRRPPAEIAFRAITLIRSSAHSCRPCGERTRLGRFWRKGRVGSAAT